MFALLLACAGPPPAPSGPDLSAYAGPELACLQAHCGTAAAEALASCRAEKCAEVAPTWAVNPTLLRYDAGTVTMSVDVDHTPGTFGDVAVPEGETYLGATVLTKSGEEIDMAVHTVFPDHLDEPFTFSSQVGEDVQVVIVGLWGKKIEPCDSSRSGCKMFGFVLDKSLAAWPEETYVATAPRRQRFLPGTLGIRLKFPAANAVELSAALSSALKQEAERFGTTFTGADLVQTPRPDEVAGAAAAPGVVFHKDPNDGPLATRLAQAVAGVAGTKPVTCFDATAADDLVVDLTAAPPAGAACR